MDLQGEPWFGVQIEIDVEGCSRDDGAFSRKLTTLAIDTKWKGDRTVDDPVNPAARSVHHGFDHRVLIALGRALEG